MNKIYIEPAKTERQYRKLRELGQKLGVPVPETFIEMEVTMPDGKVVHHHKQRSHTWVRNAYNVLVAQMMAVQADDVGYGAGFINVKDLTAAVRSHINPLHIGKSNQAMELVGYGYRGGAGIDNKGIVVGSGVGAENFEATTLGTKIANGVGAGQLSYAECDAPVQNYNAGTKVYSTDWVRYLNNNSGGDVNVNEVGLDVHGSINVEYQWLHSRDKLGATVTVPDTGQLKVTYTIQLTYPA